MRVNFVLSGMARDRFSAGQFVIMEHAHELARRGHDVTLIPTMPSYRPDWFDVKVRLLDAPSFEPARAPLRSARSLARYALRGRDRHDLTAAFTEASRQVASRSQMPYRVAAMTDRLRQVVPPADVTLATAASTALPVWLCGSGEKAYFMQHHEVLFAPESDDPETERSFADLTYRLPLNRIANCSWLAREIAQNYGGEQPALCLNAIDHRRYFRDGSPDAAPLTIVSYSGRQAPWKDLRTAAHAIRIVRESVPDLRWLVYGAGGLLPPDNEIAPYESVGFMGADQLRGLYSRAHVLLAASWYESFPLPPLEAMACGCAVVTTPLGTEDFARDRHNARIVPAREAAQMAAAILDLWKRPDERARLVAQGQQDATRFTWKASGDQMERVLTEIISRKAV